MATLRYIAFLAEDPAKLVDFYHRFLATEELGRSSEGDITITDGFYNLTFFRKRPALGEMHMDTGLQQPVSRKVRHSPGCTTSVCKSTTSKK